jgi:hypothetical protein
MTSFLDIDDSFIQQTEINGVRYYEVMGDYGQRKYPSVSTLVNSFKSTEGLKIWATNLGYETITPEEQAALSSETIRELVESRGKVAANNIRDSAARRGTKTHDLCEKYFKYGTVSDDPCFQRLLPFLKICEPLTVETKVKWEWRPSPDVVVDLPENTVVGWSGRLDKVGKVDLTKLYTEHGVLLGNTSTPAIIDYKTWDKAKYNSGQTKAGSKYYPLLSYYLQLSAYLAGFNQCKYYSQLVDDAFLVGVTVTCREPWIYHINLEKVNFYFKELKAMVLAYYKLGTYSWEALEEKVEPYLGERVYINAPKLPF